MKDGIAIGVYRSLPGEGFYLDQEDGSTFPLEFENPIRADEVPMNMPVAIVIENGKVPDSDNFWQEVPVFSAGRRNETQKYIAICSKTGGAPRSHARKVQEFWLTFAHKYWDVRTFAFGMDDEGVDCPAMPNWYCAEDMRRVFDALPEDKKPDWYPVHWYITGGHHKHYCGQAQLGGTLGVSYTGALGCGGVDTIWHELGHNFGLHHASSNIDGEWIEYGDGSSIMGNGPSRAGLNAVNMYHLGLYDDDELNRVSTNRELVVCPHEIPKDARHSNETVYNLVHGTDGKDYMISSRKHKGGQHLLKEVNQHDIVYIHEIRKDRSVILGSINLGESSENIPGATVKYLEYANEVSRVEVKFQNDVTPIEPNQINPAPFPEKFTNTELGEVHDGLWYDPIRNGQGLDLHIKDGRGVLAWYFFPDNKPSGTSEWLVASFDLGEGTESFDLWSVDNKASWNNPANGEKVVVGKGQIYFTDSNKGVFQFNLTGNPKNGGAKNLSYGRGHFPITSIVRQNHEDNGAYYDPARDGEGFTLRFLAGGKRCVGYWYTYMHKLDQKQGFQRRRWFLLDGELKNGRYELTASSVDGRFLGINVNEVVPKPEGKVYLRPRGEGKFKFKSEVRNYNLDTEIVRLF